VYHVLERNIYIIQQRSPTVRGRQNVFCEGLHALLTSLQYELALVVTGASREEVEVRAGLFHISSAAARAKLEGVAPPLAAAVEAAVSYPDATGFTPHGMGQAELLWRASAGGKTQPLHSAALPVKVDPLMVPTVFDTGAAAAAAAAKASVLEVPVSGKVVVLGKLCNEGNNAGDGVEMALVLLNGLGLAAAAKVAASPVDVVTPASWLRAFGKNLSEEESMFC
jgi:hypothetical protein